jgi:hypothetical protein
MSFWLKRYPPRFRPSPTSALFTDDAGRNWLESCCWTAVSRRRPDSCRRFTDRTSDDPGER